MDHDARDKRVTARERRLAERGKKFRGGLGGTDEERGNERAEIKRRKKKRERERARDRR